MAYDRTMRQTAPQARVCETMKRSWPLDEILSPELASVQTAIDGLEREERANLRPWMLAHFDELGGATRRVHDTGRSSGLTLMVPPAQTRR